MTDDICLIIAHPDDESMFFTPFIHTYHSHPRFANANSLFILCLSNGSSLRGLNGIRCKELIQAARVLGIHKDHVRIVDHPQLPDGMNVFWDTDLIADIISEFLDEHPSIGKLVTFDKYGVSGHPNHIAVSGGVETLLQLRKLNGYVLESTSICRKYIGLLDYFYSRSSSSIMMYQGCVPNKSWQAMRAHYSQFVWFRKLFVFFSRYSYFNTLYQIA